MGNGEFAFTADITGLQTFHEEFEKTVPLCTQSQWGWHTFPLSPGMDPGSLRPETYDTHGRPVGYATNAAGQQELFAWLRENPHRLHLGRIAFRLERHEVTEPDQTLDLWTGILASRFRARGTPVTVRTCCHPRLDLVAVEVESTHPYTIALEFPYGSPGITAADWTKPNAHRTLLRREAPGRRDFARILDNDRYYASLGWEGEAKFDQTGAHAFELRATGRLAMVCLFSPRPPAMTLPHPGEVFEASASCWARFWSEGGAVELAASKDPRAGELERRIVLSQYLTAIQCAGSLPPQETGLTCNSWYGKFHLEMHWWHAVHFALWDRLPMLERSLPWYQRILPEARKRASSQGYAGARWPKMTGPAGIDSPSPIGPLLIWQQPHPIVYAELCYQTHPDRETLDRYRELVFESADFMASYAWFDSKRRQYVLGPPLIPAQEIHPPRETWNPAFELAYWAHGLRLAGGWRRRLGLPPKPEWESVLRALAPLPERDGVYLAHENCPQTFTGRNRDHPSMLAALGVLPGEGVDRETMRRTLHKVWNEWRWEDTWGWDFPMTAMTAARLGETGLAVDALLRESPKNEYLANGHNYQRPGLGLYLPGNGGLLAAVAMMAGGWRGGPRALAPGFPKHAWTVQAERLRPLL